MSKVNSMILVAIGSALLAGCGAVAQDGEMSVEDVAELGAAFSESSCATSPHDDLISNAAPHFRDSSTNYNTCGKGWVLNVDNIVRSDFGPNLSCDGSQTRGINVSWRAAAPTTQAECEASEVSGYVYHWNPSTHVYVSMAPKKTALGVWDPARSPDHCVIPTIRWKDTGVAGSEVSFVEGDSYRFAVTGRASDGSVRKITINSFKGGASCGG